MKTIVYTLALVALLACAACAIAPTVTSIVARQLTDGTGRVSITYNLADSDSATVYISVAISTNGGSTYSARNYVTGDVGWVRPGSGRRMTWDAKTDLGASAVFPSCKARITADDSSGGVYPGQMISIPAGSFLMGNSGIGNDGVYASSYPRELPQHSVILAAYNIGKYEVTRGEYQAFMTAGGYSNSVNWSSAGWSWKVSNSRTQPYYWAANQDWYGGQPFTQTDSHPVVGVSYYEAEAYCNWAGGHLPTEAQWERAARWTGSHPNVYPWGDVWDAEKCNNYYDHNTAGGGYQKYQTAPVGSYSSYPSPSGCQDMAGNVWEWCKDWYGSTYYSTSPTSDPQGPTSGSYRVLRGGSWGDSDNLTRCAFRYSTTPGNYYSDLGFRLAR